MTTIEPMPPAPMPAQSNASGARAATTPFLEWLQPNGAFARHGGSHTAAQETPSVAQSVDSSAEALALVLTAADADDAIATTARLEPQIPPHAAVSADDAQTTLDLSSPIAVEMRSAQGTQEIVALPWRLAGSGLLDRRSISSELGGIAGAAASASAAVDPQPGVRSASAVGVAAARTATDGSRLPPASPSSAYVAAESQRRVAVSLGDPQVTVGAPVAAEWLQRWTRWIERDGRDPAVWLRDYRLDADGVRRLVDTLQAFAREHGFSLERIVVNGRERWRADATRAEAPSFPHSNQE